MTIAELFAKLKIQPDAKSFDAADKAIGAVKTALGVLAAAAGVRFFAGLIQDTTTLGGKLNDMSVASATNVETLQELGYAAVQNGSSLEGVNTTLTKLGQNLYEAANGNKAMAEGFARAGIKVKDAEGKLRPAADVLGDIADRLASIPEEERAGVAMELLGKSGKELIPTLAGGSEALEAMKKEARELGAVISEDGVKALDDFGDEQDKVKAALGGLRNTVVAELLPTLKEMVSDLLAWVKANRQIIAQKLKFVLEGIVGALKVFAKIVGTTVSLVEWLGNHMGVLAAGILAVAAALVIFQGASIAAALASAAAWIWAALPIAIVALGLFAIILILQDLYSWFSGGDSVLKDFFGLFKTWIAEKLTWLWDHTIGYLIDAFSKFIDWVVEKIEWVWDKIKGVGDAIAGFFTEGGVMEIAGRFEEGTKQGLTGQALEDFVQTGALQAPTITIPESGGATSIQATTTIQVTPPPGSDPKAIADATKKAFDEHMAATLRQAKAGTGGK